jgi:hypothetical protein
VNTWNTPFQSAFCQDAANDTAWKSEAIKLEVLTGALGRMLMGSSTRLDDFWVLESAPKRWVARRTWKERR